MKKNRRRLFGSILVGISPLSFSFLTITSCSYEICYKYVSELAPFLHYIEYDDYVEDRNFNTLRPYPLGCTCLVKNGFLGRNFDQNYNAMPEFVVKVKAKQDRHASIGIGCHFGLRAPSFLSYKFRPELNLIPNDMVDGINDQGVVVERNTVHYESSWGEWKGIKSENPNAPEMHICFLNRYILDHANSARHAIELLKNINIIGAKGYWVESPPSLLHIIVADTTDTFIVEFINNEMYVIDFSDYDDFYPISTNFYLWPLLNNEDLYSLSYSMERYYLVHKMYESIESSVNGIFNALENVAYSNFYQPHYDDPENIWLSENFDMASTILYHKYLNGEPLTKDEMIIIEQMNAIIDDWRIRLIPEYWETIEHGWREESTIKHLSVDSVVYDIINKTMTVVSEEKFDNKYSFQL